MLKTARDLFAFRRTLIEILGRERANFRTRALIAAIRDPARAAPRADVLELATIRAPGCGGSYARGVWHCGACGADSEDDCDRK